jgi:predicted porin
MKKLLIASAALAMVAGSVQAQSSVSVYGTIDASYGDLESKVSDAGKVAAKTTSSGLTGGNANGSLTSSRLGFRGTEDLGGGLSAQFNLEYQVANGTGTTTTTNIRTSTVGLTSKQFGTFNIGRQLTGMHNVLTATSPISGNNMAGDIQYSDSVSSSDTAGISLRQHRGTNGIEAVRANNSLSYITPTMSGFNARVDYASDKSNADSSVVGNDAKLDHLGLSANYTQGNLLVTAGTHTVKGKLAPVTAKNGIYNDGTNADTGYYYASKAAAKTDYTIVAAVKGIDATNDETKFTVDAIAARYTIGAVKLNAIYSEKKQSYEGIQGYKQDAMQFGVSYDIGKVTLAGQYGEGSTKFTNGTDKTTNGAKLDNKAYQLAAIYNLSKRTNVYAVYGTDEQKQASNSTDGTFGTNGDKIQRTQYAVGLRHSF